MSDDPLARMLSRKMAKLAALPAVPAPRPRVEGERVAAIAERVTDALPSGTMLRDLALDLLEARAEVERLRGIVEEAARLLGNDGNPEAEAYYLAALALPTNAPEAKE